MIERRMADKITLNEDSTLNVSDYPIIPFIEGDGTGVDIWPAAQLVLDAAATKYGKTIEWMEVLAGETPRGARYVRSLKNLQDALGHHHDLAVLTSRIARAKTKLTEVRRPVLESAVATARIRVMPAKRDALGEVGRKLEKWPPGSLLRRSVAVVRAAERAVKSKPRVARVDVSPSV